LLVVQHLDPVLAHDGDERVMLPLRTPDAHHVGEPRLGVVRPRQALISCLQWWPVR
jgi:hypothetical protein